MTRSVGIREVARAAGVSVTTVSHALNGKGRLSETTRDRVRDVAERLGYRPNVVARRLANGRTGLIGLAVAQTLEGRFAVSDFAYYSQLMSAAGAAAIDAGYALVLASGAEAEAWRSLGIDGAIVVDPLREDALCREFVKRSLPLVTAGRVLGDHDLAPWVDNDHIVGTRTILDHLAARGAERIALVASTPVTSYAADARDGYERWCRARNQTPVIAEARDDLTESSGFEATGRLLARRRPPDAIYATLDRLALGVLLAAQARGLSVPRQLLVAGCTDSDAARWARPSLTALALNPEEIGRAAVAMLISIVEGDGSRPRNVTVPTRVLPRGSTRRRIVVRAERSAAARATADRA